MKTTLRQQKAARRELALSLVGDVYLSVRVSLCVCVCADNQRTTFGCRVGIVTVHGRDAVAAGVGGGERNESGKGGLSLGRRRRCAFTFLISTLVALQRGICVSFMCGFSAGYDAVAFATLPTSPSPSLSLSLASHPWWLLFPFVSGSVEEVSIVFCANACHASSQFTVGCLNKWA